MSPEDALAAWGGASDLRLIHQRENAVYEVRLTDGTRAALRLHRAGYQGAGAIAAELAWTEALACAGFPCPRPIRTRSGGLVAGQEGALASLVGWIAAVPIGAAGVPLDGPPEAQDALMQDLGALVGRLHRLTDRLGVTGAARPRWDAPALLGETPHWGRFWDNPALDPAESAMLSALRPDLRAALAALEPPDMGLIHADLLQENLLRDAGGLWVIDFDDAGVGFRGYDLGTVLIQHAEHPRLADLALALARGYGAAVGRPAADIAQMLPLFTLLRGLASVGWIASRAAPDDPRQRAYCDRALRLAQGWRDHTSMARGIWAPTSNTRL